MARTLDEAIAQYQEKAEYFKTTTNVAHALELKQRAEWLEELKAYESDEFTSSLQKLSYQQGYSKAESDYFEKTQIDRESSYKIGYEVGYNRAIDDLIVKYENAKFIESEIVLSDIHQGTNSGLSMAIHFAEQLKAGESE